MRLHQLAGLVEVVIDDGLGVDADGVVDGGEKFGRVDRILDGGGAGGVGFSVHVAAVDAGAAADGSVVVSGQPLSASGNDLPRGSLPQGAFFSFPYFSLFFRVANAVLSLCLRSRSRPLFACW